MKVITHDDMVSALREFISAQGRNAPVKRAARLMSTQPNDLSAMARGRRPITRRVARYMGYTPVKMYKSA